MLDMTRTRVERAFERNVYSADQILEAGLCLTTLLENNKQVVRRSNAQNNSIFAGVSWGNYLGANLTIPQTNVLTAGTAVKGSRTDAGVASVTLPYPATSTADMLVIAGANYGAAAGMANVANTNNAAAVTNDTQYALSQDGTTIYVYGDLAGTGIFVSQRYAPNANAVRLMYGDMYLPTGAVALGRIGSVVRGHVYTNDYDTSVDWSTASDMQAQNIIRGGANGRFTLNSNGALCAGATVLSVPSASDPWLGLEINVAKA